MRVHNTLKRVDKRILRKKDDRRGYVGQRKSQVIGGGREKSRHVRATGSSETEVSATGVHRRAPLEAAGFHREDDLCQSAKNGARQKSHRTACDNERAYNQGARGRAMPAFDRLNEIKPTRGGNDHTKDRGHDARHRASQYAAVGDAPPTHPSNCSPEGGECRYGRCREGAERIGVCATHHVTVTVDESMRRKCGQQA